VAPSTDILIGDTDTQHVLIRPLSRRHPGLFDYAEANGIECEVEIVAGVFSGTVRADVRSEEFQAFLDEVEGMIGTLEGAATLATMEGQLSVAIAIEGSEARHEQMRVSGDVSDAPGSSNRLHFAFEVERAQLPAIAQALNYLLAAFPLDSSGRDLTSGRVET
jgi:hypothetical protein